ncbi:myosin heavy chain 95F-like [Contarinia nasturtii]|uniref:myosin heavy chain 95F-like n=1 Tax=Contarinia nasturtii TaxID=265458 RepID=UPI0012D41E88|nr:myosin heavy chain 95F-like [Contarinia nasturtii]
MHNMYTDEVIQKYAGKKIGSMPPHIYSIAEEAFQNLKQHNSQSVIITGLSGAGKTETTKHLIKYLCNSSPLLFEAFGNANTAQNRNSSRFIKIIEIQYDGGSVANIYNTYSLLESSRASITSCEIMRENNFYIFYYLAIGSSHELQNKLQLKGNERM